MIKGFLLQSIRELRAPKLLLRLYCALSGRYNVAVLAPFALRLGGPISLFATFGAVAVFLEALKRREALNGFINTPA